MVTMKKLTTVAVALLLGCGGKAGSGADGPGIDAGVDHGNTCKGAGFGGGESPQPVTSATATIIKDTAGVPVAGLSVWIAGLDLTSAPGKTSAAGAVTVSANMNFKSPALRFGDGLVYPQLLAKIDEPATTFAFLVTAKFPDSGPALVPGSVVKSGDLTLALPAGGAIQVDTLSYDTPDKQALRAVTLPVSEQVALIRGMGFEILLAVAPAATTFCPPAAVTVPNSPEWPAGTSAEFFVMGGDVSQEWAPWAAWTHITDGVVSADGKTITTYAAGGLPVLATLAIRKGR